MLRLSKHLCRLSAVVSTLWLCASPAFAHTKHRVKLDSSLVPLETALESNDPATAQAVATSIYQQAVNAATSTDPTVIIDPSVVTSQSVVFAQCKTAYEIAYCFYRYADLADAQQWAMTATAVDTLNDSYARRAMVLLGNIAYAMDQDGVAATNFLTVIVLPNLYPEQASAYAGLLNVLMMQQQNDQAAQWVQNGQAQFAGAGDLQLAFLQDAERVLKQRDHPLWRDLDQQIVDLLPTNTVARLQPLRELASNARKFERWAEAETNYAALCAMPLSTARDTVDTWFLLAESQAKQGKDVTATLRNLTAVCDGFADTVDCDYGTYRLGKFYERRGSNDLATAAYSALVSSSSTSTWAGAALHQLGALKELAGDLPGALQLYLQYPQRFPQNEPMVMQAYSSALNVAGALGDTNSANLVYHAIIKNGAAIQDYNVMLNLGRYFNMQGNQQLAVRFLENGLSLAQQALNSTTDPAQRALIQYRMLNRMNDFSQYQRILGYFKANATEFPGPGADPNSDENHLQCYAYQAMAFRWTGDEPDATTLLEGALDRAQGNAQLEGEFGEYLAVLCKGTNSPAALQLFEWVAQKYPSHKWANVGRLQLAIQAFNSGNFANALKLTDDITNGLTQNSKLQWIQNIYWSAVYLRGACLQAQGQTQDGAALEQLATSQFPELDIQTRLSH
jgi:TolA-binding protein